MVDVGRLEEPQRVAPGVDRVAVAHALHAVDEVDPERGQVEDRRHVAADELGVRRLVHEALHAAALVALEVEQHDVREAGRVEHLADRLADAVVGLVHAGVNQHRGLVVDQELVEGDRDVGIRRSGDPVDAVDDLVDLRHVRSFR